MRKSIIATAFMCMTVILLLVAGGLQGAHAQKATEIYIPIGHSPGLTGYTKIGTITSMDMSARMFTMRDSLDQVYTVHCTDSTSIYLDKSKIKERSRVGTMEDMKEGLLTEVKFYLAPDSTYLEVAEWVKVRVEASN